jgi:hypothetical protein
VKICSSNRDAAAAHADPASTAGYPECNSYKLVELFEEKGCCIALKLQHVAHAQEILAIQQKLMPAGAHEQLQLPDVC